MRPLSLFSFAVRGAVPGVVLGAALLLAGCEPRVSSPVLTASTEGATCAVPADLTPARPYTPPADEVAADVPVAFNMLAVSWSPQACRAGKDYPDERYQCASNQFGLTLHGLWPNGGGDRHPRYCAHGTCGWDSPEAYFEQAAKMWNGLNKPDLEAIPTERLTAGAIRDAFVAANPGLPREGVFIATTDGWFREARLCYSKDYRPMRCPRGLGAPDRERLRLAPTGASQTTR